MTYQRAEKTKLRHFLSIADASIDQLNHLFDVAFALRAQRQEGRRNDPLLAGKTLAMIFEKPSLRTRVSFEQAMLELGGSAIVMGSAEVGLGKRESAGDVAAVLSGMVHGIVARVFEHQKLLDMAARSTIPVINALSDLFHPCQALADAMTLIDQFGRDLTGRTLAYVGDGNNVVRSLATLCAMLGVNFAIATPPDFELDPTFVAALRDQYRATRLLTTHQPAEAVRDADAVYTDTWVSMGQETEADQRLAAFAGYQVNADLLAAAPDHAIVMHCLPAYRNVEITDEVIDGPQSRVFAQAHNRLHAQKGLLAVLMADA